MFKGTTDPMEANEWLRNTKRVLDRIDCDDPKKVEYAVSLFEEDARDWWEIRPESRVRPLLLSWDAFVALFNDKYLPFVFLEQKKNEFLSLKQEGLSISEYEVKFDRLSKYAPEEVSTEEKRMARFVYGLQIDIKEKMAASSPSYKEMIATAIRAERNYQERLEIEAKRKKTASTSSAPAKSSGGGSSYYRGGGSQSGGFRGRGFGRQSQASTFPGGRGGSGGRFGDRGGRSGWGGSSFSGGSSQAPECEECHRRHTGECWGPNPIRCYLCNRIGHISRDCPNRRVDKSKEMKVEETPIVNEFLDVFPDDLPGLPPHRELDFEIETFPGVSPISIAPY